ncbi:MAG: redoxin family protein [Labilithrix sp.]|nr:redoxin family protein [Labilithrix sp.]
MKSLMSAVVVTALSFVMACTTETGGGSSARGDEDPGLPRQEAVTPPSASPSEPGAPSQAEYLLPSWMREDVQPKSARFSQTHGLDSYRGKTVVVILLEGFCPFCRSNSVVAQALQDELDAEKLDVQIVVLGDAAASEFASRVSLPIFRDADGRAWEEMRKGASKHDTFVFGPNGLRTHFLHGTYQGEPARWRTEIGAEVRKVARKL